MTERIKELWDGLNVETVANKRELFLELLVCLLAGVLLGFLISPVKRMMVGCYNGDCLVADEQDGIE